MRRTLAESRASFVGFVPTASLASCKASTAAFNEERAPLGRRDLVSIIETKGGGERERGGVNLLAGVRFPARYLMKCGNISIPPFPLAPFPQRFFQMTVLVSGRNKHTVSRSFRGPRHGYLHMDGDQGFRNPAAPRRLGGRLFVPSSLPLTHPRLAIPCLSFWSPFIFSRTIASPPKPLSLVPGSVRLQRGKCSELLKVRFHAGPSNTSCQTYPRYFSDIGTYFTFQGGCLQVTSVRSSPKSRLFENTGTRTRFFFRSTRSRAGD